MNGKLWRRIDIPWAGIAAALLALAIGATDLWRGIEAKLFDRLIVASAPNSVALPITIVGIDEASFAKLKLQWPWPRSLHARLLDRLREAGVAVAAFDVVFAEPSSPAEDAALAAAVRRQGSVVMAADLAYEETGSVRRWVRVEPLEMFRDAGAVAGLASVQLDADGVLRQVPVHRDAFWSQVLALLEKRLPGTVSRLDATPNMRIRYFGGPHTFSYVSYYQLLEPDKYLPPDWKSYFNNGVVIVGRDLKAETDIGNAQSDMFQTPFSASTHQFTPGPEVQANLVAAMASGVALWEAPRQWAVAFCLLAAGLAIVLMRRWSPWRSSLVGAGLLGGIAAVDYGLFTGPAIWLPAANAMLAVGMVYLAQGILAFLFENRQRRQIKKAFSTYVAPAVVEQVIAQPEKLRLGGERRELTLLFSDLAGFTSISESMDAERVAHLLNRHLTEMTEVIQRHQGTVDKFIGDAVMAFWGAPLPDPQQSQHAVQAAIEMADKVARMREEVLAGGGPELFIRIGIHRGECIVGNMGGESRFDYTAIGDAVNLASRLEGVNKVYGTTILLSDAVAQALAGGVPLREVDTVRVKGKRLGVTIHTPCADEGLIGRSHAALEAYRSGRWELALAQWREIVESRGDDPVAQVFLQRIEAFREAGWPAAWDGVTVLDSK